MKIKSELTLVSLKIMLIIMGPFFSFSSIEWKYLYLFLFLPLWRNKMIFLIKDGGGGERERLHVCMLPIKQEKGIVGSWIALLPRYCLLWVPHVLLISLINGQDLCFFFFF